MGPKIERKSNPIVTHQNTVYKKNIGDAIESINQPVKFIDNKSLLNLQLLEGM